MDEGPRIFTLDEANALVPRLELELGDLARLRSELEGLIEVVGGAEAAMAILQHGHEPPAGHAAAGTRLHRVADEITAGVERIHALGCVLKDIDEGLVDFYAVEDGEPAPVFLCWQLGEPAIAHWHPVGEGFSARRRIEGVVFERPHIVN